MKLKDFTSAATCDILDLLKREDPRAHEFNRIESIAKICTALSNASGQFSESDTILWALKESEYKAPTLHEALMKRSFDGDAILLRKYNELSAFHSELRHAQLNIQDAQDDVSAQRKILEAHKEMLQAHEKQLERERERLMLTASEKKVRLLLPEIPKLEDDDDDEDVDEDVYPNKFSE